MKLGVGVGLLLLILIKAGPFIKGLTIGAREAKVQRCPGTAVETHLLPESTPHTHLDS